MSGPSPGAQFFTKIFYVFFIINLMLLSLSCIGVHYKHILNSIIYTKSNIKISDHVFVILYIKLAISNCLFDLWLWRYFEHCLHNVLLNYQWLPEKQCGWYVHVYSISHRCMIPRLERLDSAQSSLSHSSCTKSDIYILYIIHLKTQ